MAPCDGGAFITASAPDKQFKRLAESIDREKARKLPGNEERAPAAEEEIVASTEKARILSARVRAQPLLTRRA